MIESAEHLHAELLKETDGLCRDAIAARLASKGDRLRTLAALYRRYDHAERCAHKFGFTGFRRFTYAERRIAHMQCRLSKLAM